MRTLGLATMIALASTAAYAGSVFEIPIDGAKARIHFNENCRKSLCASVSWTHNGKRRVFKLPGISSKTFTNLFGKVKVDDFDDEDEDFDETIPESKYESAVPPPRWAVEPPAAAPVAARPRDRRSEPRATARPRNSRSEPRVAAAVPADRTDRTPSTTSTRPKVTAVAPDPAPAPTTKPARPSPIGEWLVEDGEGRVRIEQCGARLCGYVSEAKNPNERDRKNPNPKLRNRSVIGMPILINMKPSGKRWKGRIYNAKDGRTYKATIALKGPDRLRVRGCAFGGIICGGQTWSRAD